MENSQPVGDVAATTFGPNDPATIKHVEIYQALITRMAGNSTSCKQWCVLIVTAVIAFLANQDMPGSVLLAFIPIIALGMLDIYYLSLEVQFREAYNTHMEKLRKGGLGLEDIYAIKASGKLPQTAYLRHAARSPSITLYYPVLVVVTLLAAMFV